MHLAATPPLPVAKLIQSEQMDAHNKAGRQRSVERYDLGFVKGHDE
jgi:hypothetical protein